MKSDFLSTILEGDYQFDEIDNMNKRYESYQMTKEQLARCQIESYSLEELLDIVRNSKYYSTFVNSINNIDENKLYTSFGHGIYHNERTALFAFAIATLQNLDEEDIKLVLDAAKYHDIGRVDDREDKDHGKRSARQITFLEKYYQPKEMKCLRTIITGHSVDDRQFDNIALVNQIKDYDHCKKLYNILKDADGLDRVRLRYPDIDISYLRTEESKKMVSASFELYYNFEEIVKKDSQLIKVNRGS